MYMCSPEGEALRQQWVDALNMLKRDNQYVIAAMLADGQEVPDTVVDAGLEYVPSRHEVVDGDPVQALYGMKAMFDSGEFSCGDAAAYEAAVAEEKYGVPAECSSTPMNDEGDFHGIFITPLETVDPTENWMQHWEYMTGAREDAPTLPRHLTGAPVPRMRRSGARCSIRDGRVVCDVDDSRATCVDVDRGVWRSADRQLNGQPVKVVEVFEGRRTGQRWAKTDKGVFVPVCKSTGRRARRGNNTRARRRLNAQLARARRQQGLFG